MEQTSPALSSCLNDEPNNLGETAALDSLVQGRLSSELHMPVSTRERSSRNSLDELAPLLPQIPQKSRRNISHQSMVRPSTSFSIPHSASSSVLRRISSDVPQIPHTWSNYCLPFPYTEENRPKRKPFHLSRTSSASQYGAVDCAAAEENRDPLPNLKNSPAHLIVGSEVPNRERSSVDTSHSQLYTRYRYYSRLRAAANPDEHALLIPDHIVPVDLFIPFIPYAQTVGPDGKQASIITIISIWNTMMGTSILTMPWAFGKAGFIGGLMVMFLMAFISSFTAYRTLTVQTVAGLSGPLLEVSSLCRSIMGGVLGRALEGVAVFFSIVTLLGALIVYWVLMSNFLYNTGQVIHDAVFPVDSAYNFTNTTVDLLCPANSSLSNLSLHNLASYSNTSNSSSVTSGFDYYWDQRLTVPFFLLVIFIPLLCIKNTRIFSYFNSLGAVSVAAIYIFVVSRTISWGLNTNFQDLNDPQYMPLFSSSFMALSGTLSLAYFIHNCIITIMKGNRKQENNVRDLAIAYFMVMATYIPIGVLFYIAFPLPKFCLADNFLDNFPPHAVVLAVVRVFLLFQMITVYPLLCVFLRTQLLVYVRGPTSPPPGLFVTHVVNVFILIFCVLVAVFYPNVGFLIRWIGAFSGLVYVFVLPCMLYLAAMYQRKQLYLRTLLLHGLIVCIGLANFVAQFFL